MIYYICLYTAHIGPILFILLFYYFNYFYMAHKKAGGSSTNLRDSKSKRLGLKLHDGQTAKPGAILVRQRGTKYHPGSNVRKGNDDTLFSTAQGTVKFTSKKLKKFDGRLKQTTIVNVEAEK